VTGEIYSGKDLPKRYSFEFKVKLQGREKWVEISMKKRKGRSGLDPLPTLVTSTFRSPPLYKDM